MKKHHLIYSFLLFLIASISSCEKAVIEKTPDTQAATRSNTDCDIFFLYNSNFQDIRSSVTANGTGIDYKSGEIHTYSEGVEYDFTLFTQIKGNVKCVVWGSSGIYSNGKNYPSILGVNGKEVNFTIKFNQPTTKIHLALETDYVWNTYKEASARLIIGEKRYKGKTMYGGNSFQEGSFDLYVEARYDFEPATGSTETMWMCSSCGSLNDINRTTCISCGK